MHTIAADSVLRFWYWWPYFLIRKVRVLDPRQPGDTCYSGYWQRQYIVVRRDPDDLWLCVFENGSIARLDKYWNTKAGDRILARAPAPASALVVNQLQLFTLETGETPDDAAGNGSLQRTLSLEPTADPRDSRSPQRRYRKDPRR